MKRSFSALFILLPILLQAQDKSYNQTYSAAALVNPAFTGITMEPRISGQYHFEYNDFGIREIKQNRSLYYDQRIFKSGSFGVYFNEYRYSQHYNDRGLVWSYYSPALQYAHSINIGNHLQVCAGTSLGMKWGRIHGTPIFWAEDRPWYYQRKISPAPVLGLGMMISNKYFFLGINGQDLNAPRINYTYTVSTNLYTSTTTVSDKISRTASLQSGVFIHFNTIDEKDLILIPGFNSEVQSPDDFRIHPSLNFIYGRISGGFSFTNQLEGYRYQYFTGVIGATFHNLRVGYSFSHAATDKSLPIYMAHEINVAYFLPNTKERMNPVDKVVSYYFKRLF